MHMLFDLGFFVAQRDKAAERAEAATSRYTSFVANQGLLATGAELERQAMADLTKASHDHFEAKLAAEQAWQRFARAMSRRG